MENVEGFSVEEKDGRIHITFYDIVENGVVYTFDRSDAFKIMRTLQGVLYSTAADQPY